ncbi:MAG: serine hydrolase [Pirellulales bacterium]|nr:serine hydrolase [Pirellulales bacterium]
MKIGPDSRYAAVAESLRKVIRSEIAAHQIPGFAIALVDGEHTVWAEGFGHADLARSRPAGADTLFRVGSVSKVFTAMAVMQLVEAGKLDLDAPVTKYLPDFHPQNPFDQPITLRQLMSHRSGLVREPPVGSYFDASEPSVEEAIASLNDTELVYEPTKRTKYSNAGVTVVGRVVEVVCGRPLDEYVREEILAPLAARDTTFAPGEALRPRIAEAAMWTYDGRVFPAPTFELATTAAGNLYSTAIDQARFLELFFAGGRGGDRQVLQAETLRQMWQPQFPDAEGRGDFGLGFALARFEGHERVRHGGAVYGFSTELTALTDVKLGVAAMASMDVSNAIVNRIADHALRLMLAVREGKPLPTWEATGPIPPERAKRLAGSFRGSKQAVELFELAGKLYLWHGSSRGELRQRGDGKLVVDDRHEQGTVLEPLGEDRLKIGDETLARVQTDAPPSAPPERWKGLIGEYGPDHNTLYVLERNGKLHALIEWIFCYELEELDENTFAFPNEGLYHGERIVFTRDDEGRTTRAVAAGVAFERRETGPPPGETFKVEPVVSVESLRPQAAAASPPREEGDFLAADLVELAGLDPTIKYDIRYATTNNFLGSVFYQQARAMMQRPAAEALVRANQSLAPLGYGLLIHDAYRPWAVTRMFWDATPEAMRHFVANPAKGSRHNRGCAVDLTLYTLADGQPVEMVGGYDEFSMRSYPSYPGGTSRQRWQRELLRRAIEAQGFNVYEFEWWHFDFGDWQRYPILNQPFEEIPRS